MSPRKPPPLLAGKLPFGVRQVYPGLFHRRSRPAQSALALLTLAA
jgi:hypothetical protein